MEQPEYRGDMSEEAYRQWEGVLSLLAVMNLAIRNDKRVGVGQGQYRMHTQRSPNVRRPAHE